MTNSVRMSYIRYMIIGMGRSGTTVVHTSLRGHPSISATNGEIKIKPLFDQGLATYMISGNSYLDEVEKREGVKVLFDAINSIGANKKTMAIGCKVALWRPQDAALLVKSIQENFTDLKIILVEREDIVAQYGSSLRAKATKQYHQWTESKSQNDDVVFRIPIRDFFSYALRCHQIKQELAALEKTHDVFKVSYEKDILSQDLGVYDRAFNFLGVTTEKVTWTKARKVAPAPEEYIVNYGQLCEQLAEFKLKNFDQSKIKFSYSENILLVWQKLTRKVYRLFSKFKFSGSY